MRNVLIRLLIAVFVVVVINLALPAFLNILGFGLGRDFGLLLRLAIAVFAILYVVWGPPPRSPFAT